MSFLSKLKNNNFVQWLIDIFKIQKQVLIPEAITIETVENTTIQAEPKRLNKFEQFQAEITNSDYYKSLSEKNQIRYLNTIKKLYVCLGGRIPRKQPFVLRSITDWHNQGKIDHFSNITENWTYEYSAEFEKYLSKYKETLANTVINFDTKTSLDYLQANPSKINLDSFPPVIKEADNETEDLNQIIRPINYTSKEENEVTTEAVSTNMEKIDALFDELFLDINKEPQKEDVYIRNLELEQLFDQIFGTSNTVFEAKENEPKTDIDEVLDQIFTIPNQSIPVELLSNTENIQNQTTNP